MKTTVILMVLAALVSCGKKKESSSTSAVSLLSLQSKGISVYSTNNGYGGRAAIYCYSNGTTAGDKRLELVNLQASLQMGHISPVSLGGGTLTVAEMNQLLTQAIYTLQTMNPSSTYCPQVLSYL